MGSLSFGNPPIISENWEKKLVLLLRSTLPVRVADYGKGLPISKLKFDRPQTE